MELRAAVHVDVHDLVVAEARVRVRVRVRVSDVHDLVVAEARWRHPWGGSRLVRLLLFVDARACVRACVLMCGLVAGS